MRVIPGIRWRLRDGPGGGVPGGRECHKCSVSVQYIVQPIDLDWQHVRPSMLDETILRAGSDKDPC